MSKPTYVVLSRQKVPTGTFVRVTFNPVIDLTVSEEMPFWNKETKEVEMKKVKKTAWSETHTYFVKEDQKEEEVLSIALWVHQKGLEEIKSKQGNIEESELEVFEALPLKSLKLPIS